MLIPRCGNGSGSRFLVRHGFRQAKYYNRLEPSFIQLVWTNPDVQACDPGHRGESGDSSICSGGSSGSSKLFLVPQAQGWDTLLPNTPSQRKGAG
jgi:hypothetical protein